MRRALPQCARLVALAVFAAACSPKTPAAVAHGRAPVNVTATCSGNQITVAVDPSTVTFTHTGGGQQPTDVNWTLAQSSNVDSVTITPDAPAQWPFDSTPPFHARKARPFLAPGKDSQPPGHYRYSLTVTCPNGNSAVFDPDIWVD